MKQITNVYVEPFRRTCAVIDVDTNSLGIFIEQGRSPKKLKSCIRTWLKKKKRWDRRTSSMVNKAIKNYQRR